MTINGDLQVSKVPIPQFLFCKGVGIKAQACFIPNVVFADEIQALGLVCFFLWVVSKKGNRFWWFWVGFEMGMGQN